MCLASFTVSVRISLCVHVCLWSMQLAIKNYHYSYRRSASMHNAYRCILQLILTNDRKIGVKICVSLNYLFIWGHFQHCIGHITTGSWKGRGNQYIRFVMVLYCKLPTNGKQIPAFPLEAGPGTKPRPQRWEARVLPLCHRGPLSH